jgi:uncharacterized DUF497 family protein
MVPVRYEWDEAKRVENLEKHGIDFEAVRRFDWIMSVSGADRRHRYGEERIVAFAPIDGRVHAVVYTIRGDTRRIISLRKANRREQAAYAIAISARLVGG